jgi:serine/threonine protein kinase
VSDAETVKGLSTRAEYDPQAVDELATLSGRTLTRYAIGPVLGKGTTGMVFRATDTEDGRTVALKVMQPAYARNDDDMQRFVRAMRAMMPLTHPNLVKVYAAGKNGPYCWAAMELVEGESLTAVIKRIGAAGMLDWKYAHRVGTHLARALAYAHDQVIIHRDISPANILIETADQDGQAGRPDAERRPPGGAVRLPDRPAPVVRRFDPRYDPGGDRGPAPSAALR